ncbi:methyltransferase [Permianibacter sp. IMCC34836]|uniref:tRNA1(Val) (adenine(37)-N6)-methyltransferase n=1 Tax=Permianibacter fluminis TaxID=2738515 RepID=UPI0015525178|nr:methyltransferase [Permianibacter fluminis]NQD35706.1 methyltransferase [Permianibacter fluminis]
MRQRKHNDWFQFKQFRVEQAHSGMRVTTHACLFGALVPVAGARRILDIGAGTGLLSLMLAQRSEAQIDAVELDAGACQDAARNFAASPWSQRLYLHAGAIQQFAPPVGDGYDCIVSNPPFFSASWRADDEARNLARHDDSLSLQSLLQLASTWLRDDGQLWLLLPVEADQRLQEAAAMAALQCCQQIDIRAKPDKPVARRIFALIKPALAKSATAEPAATPALARRELCIHDPYPAYSHEALQLLRPYYSSL